MGIKIKGSESAIKDIFCEKFDFHIPPYQRPYAWTEEEALTLFDDLYDFLQAKGEDNCYFLGSIVLEKENEELPFCQVIDGQQRLTTLTILLAVLISKFNNQEAKNAFEKYIRQPADISQGLKSKPRLELRAKDRDFFNQYIQDMNFRDLFNKQVAKLKNEAQKNIYLNSLALNDKIDELLKTDNDKIEFGRFLITNCYLVVVTTSSRESAFRVFSVMNNRGLSLLATDIIKSDIIGMINDVNEDLVEKYTNKWEDIETLLGRDSFNDLFSHIRTLKSKIKAKKGLIGEFKEYVLPNLNHQTSIEFIETVLEPYAHSYNLIRNCCYNSENKDNEINGILKWLNSFNHSDWIPSSMYFISVNENNPELILTFLEKMERLCPYMYADSFDVNDRIARFAKIVKELEVAHNAIPNSLELNDEEKETFIKVLDGQIYCLTNYKRNYFILRLDSFIATNGINYQKQKLSIEHVLPQTVNQNSEWARVWPNENERNLWVHRIGNLLPLTQAVNSECQNYDYLVKKQKYYTSKKGTSSYALTSRMILKETWTPEDVEKNQIDLMEIYKKHGELM